MITDYLKIFNDFMTEMKETKTESEIDLNDLGRSLSQIIANHPNVVSKLKAYQGVSIECSRLVGQEMQPLCTKTYKNILKDEIIARAYSRLDNYYRTHQPKPGIVIYCSQLQNEIRNLNVTELFSSILCSPTILLENYDKGIKTFESVLKELGYIEVPND